MRARGITLIELTIILFVIAILVAVATPYFYDLTGAASTAAQKSASGAAKSAYGLYKLENQTDPSVTALVSYMNASNMSAVNTGVQVIIDGATFVIPTYTDQACQTPTASTADAISCIKDISA